MKTLLAAIAVSLGLISAVLPASASPYSDYSNLPDWAQQAFSHPTSE